MGRRPTACQRCAAIKAKCEGHGPCDRCTRLRLSCNRDRGPGQQHVIDGSSPGASTEQQQLPAPGSMALSPSQVSETGQSESNSRVKFRARHAKSSNGCTNCRRRRKKCDEKRPTCGDCQRLNLQCLPRSSKSVVVSPPSLESAEQVTRGNFYGEDDDREERAQAAAGRHSYYLGGSRDAAPEWNAPRHGGEQDGNAMDMDEAEEDMDEEDRVVPIPDWLDIINRENFADLSSPPSLAHSSALKILPDHRANNGGPTSEEGVALPATALTYYADIDPAAQDGWTVGERHLLNHFLQAVARSMAMVEDRQNPFIRLIVPLAFESAAVRNALAALSATHLSKVYPDFERNHLLHRDMALEDLKWRLGSLETSISSLAATLLLCIGEICECRSRKWLLYLHGARALLKQVASQNNAATPLSNFLTDLYNYICCVGSATSGDVPLPWGKQFGVYTASEGRAEIHPLFGRHPDLYEYMAKINRLSRQQRSLSEGNARATDTLRREAIQLDNTLQERAGESRGSNGGHLSGEEEEDEAASRALCWALILRIRSIAWPDLDTASPDVQVPVSKINYALSLIRPGSRAEAHLLFPIFMAGVGSITKASRLTIEYRVNVAERTLGFGTVTAVHRLLDELWWKPNNGGKALAWMDLVQGQMPGLILF